MERILLVANATAGTHEVEARQEALTVLCEAAEVVVEETGSIEALDQVLVGANCRSVVVVGGDGSLHAVVNALHRRGVLASTRVGLVPMGTGNDFARGVGIPLEPAEAARLIASGRTRHTDLIIDDTGRVVVNNVHLGVGAQASSEARRWKPRLGRVGYALGGLVAGLRPSFLHVRVTVEGFAPVTGRHIAQVAIGNGSRVGGGTELIPGADPFSGYLVVIVSKAAARLARLTYLVRLRRGSHHLMKEVSRLAGRSVTVEGKPFLAVVDGEITGPHRRRTWELLPAALEMYLPDGGAQSA